MYRGYSFDDVLLLPKFSNILSRDDVSTKTYLGKDIYLSIPIISANMPAVTGPKLAIQLAQLGGLPVLHRFYKTDNELDYSQIEDNYNHIKNNIPSTSFVAISLGVKEIDKQFLYGHSNVFPIICIDVAHGHHSLVKDMILFIKEQSPNSLIIAGNVATAPGAEYLAEAGADVVKCGIGPGSVCSTRSQTGNGVPQLTALQLAANVLDKYGTKLISDGGITKAGDIVKALCFADAVMIGKMFAQTYEAPYPGQYFGNSTLKNDYVEGVTIKVSPKITVKELVKNLMDGLRSGMSYQGVDNLYDLKLNPQFIEISNAGLIESSVRYSDV
jgi:IMP dehydrogenase